MIVSPEGPLHQAACCRHNGFPFLLPETNSVGFMINRFVFRNDKKKIILLNTL